MALSVFEARRALTFGSFDYYTQIIISNEAFSRTVHNITIRTGRFDETKTYSPQNLLRPFLPEHLLQHGHEPLRLPDRRVRVDPERVVQRVDGAGQLGRREEGDGAQGALDAQC